MIAISIAVLLFMAFPLCLTAGHSSIAGQNGGLFKTAGTFSDF
jgi:hypothetical protein